MAPESAVRRANGQGKLPSQRPVRSPLALEMQALIAMTSGRDPLSTPEVEVALLDRCGVIVAVNPAWSEFAEANGGDPERCGVGTSYLDACTAGYAEDDVPEAAALVALAIRNAVQPQGAAPVTVHTSCDAPGERRCFDLTVTSRFGRGDGTSRGAAVVLVPTRAPSAIALREQQAERDREQRRRAGLERDRIAADLNDTVIRSISRTLLGLESVIGRMPEDSQRRRLEECVADLDAALGQVRRAVFGG